MLLGTALGVIGSLLPAAAFAQDASAPEPAAEAQVETENRLKTVTVSAQRREQSLDDVGISVTALSGDQLSDLGMGGAQDIVAQVPNVQFDGGSGGGLNAFLAVRGVVQVDYAEHSEAPNAVYLDDIYVAAPSMLGFKLFDVERAEVLRGPQGTLFGRNSTGGLLQVITADPTDEFEGYATAEYGSFNEYLLEGAVGGPITDNVRFRLAGYKNKADGYFENRNTGDGGTEDTFEKDSYGFRGKLEIDLNDDWSVLVMGAYNESPLHNEGGYKAIPSYTDPVTGLTQFVPADVDIYGTGAGNDALGYRDPYSDAHEGAFNSDDGYLSKLSHNESVRVEGKLFGADFTSITAASRGWIDYSEDADGTPMRVFQFFSGGVTKQFSQEFRLSGEADKLNWTTGIYFLNIDGNYFYEFDLPFGGFNSYDEYAQETTSYAAFGQIEYEFSDELKLTSGLRVTRDEKSFTQKVTFPLNDLVVYDFNEQTAPGLTKQKLTDWTGKLQLDYTPSDDLLIYAGISRGFRGGGFAATVAGGLSYEDTPYDPESILAYEAGVKYQLADLAQIRAGAFYYDYTDYQVFSFNGTQTLIGNNDASFSGLELEVVAAPWEGADVIFGASLLDSTIENVGVSDINGGVYYIDTSAVKAPEVTLNGVFSQAFSLGEGEVTFMYDFNYIGEHKANLVPAVVNEIPDSFLQNARISYSPLNADWEVYVFGKNLADDDIKNFSYDTTADTGSVLESYARPRSFGVGFSTHF